MRITKITINNFRSIKEATINLNQITAIVGENNAGKSAILRGLNAFFNYESESESFLVGRHNHTNRTTPKIEVCFYADEVPEDLKEFFNGNNLRVSFKFQGRKAIYKAHVGGRHIDFTDAREILKQHITFIFVPPNRDYQQLEIAERSLLTEITSQYIQDHTARRDIISPKVIGVARELENSVLKHVSELIARNNMAKSGYNYSIKFNSEIDYKHILHGYRFLINDGGLELPLGDVGSGIQSLTIIALYKTLATMKHRRFVLGVEEPETNLHPHAQREIISGIAADSSGGDTGLQILITTHSASVVDELDHQQIVMCRRSTTTSARPFETSVTQLKPTFFEDFRLDREKTFRFFRYQNSEFFFAKHVMLVEGKVDAEVIKFICAQEGISLASRGISILNIDGVRNLNYPDALFRSLSIPNSIVLDKDWFFNYKNDKAKDSRNKRGFPEYGQTLTTAASRMLDRLFPIVKERKAVESALRENRTEALKILEDKNVVVFRYNLETDLLASAAGASLFYNYLKVAPADRTTLKLQTTYSNAIKTPDAILHVLANLPARNWPASYRTLREHLKRLV